METTKAVLIWEAIDIEGELYISELVKWVSVEAYVETAFTKTILVKPD